MIKLFVFGPSCSGKSTLAEALEEKLGPQWTRIDRDDLIEQGLCKEEDANRLLDEKIQNLQNCCIIDTQVPWREKQEGEFYFLVLPPLETLLQRDAARAVNLKRNGERAKWAKEYIIETHTTLHQMPKESFDECLDSSVMSIEEEISKIQTIIKKFLN